MRPFSSPLLRLAVVFACFLYFLTAGTPGAVAQDTPKAAETAKDDKVKDAEESAEDDEDAAAKEGDEEKEKSFDWRAFLGPFHPVTLHLPIGFITLAVLLELYWFSRPSEPLRKAINLVLWASAISAAVAMLFGLFLSWTGGYEGEGVLDHRNEGIALAAVTLAIAMIHTVAFRGGQTRKRLAGGYRFLLLVDMGLLAVSGHSGGNLTHGSQFLVENAPESVQKLVAKLEGNDDGESGDGGQSGTDFYATEILPIFEEKCFSCHGEEKQKGDYRMDTKAGLFAAGESELDPIVKDRHMESYLVEVITLPEEDEFVMPPEGKKQLTPEEVLSIMHWIFNGAEVGKGTSVVTTK